jgi:hypothetical protein
MRDPLDGSSPVDKTQAALAEARHLLGIFHQHEFLKLGRERRVATDALAVARYGLPIPRFEGGNPMRTRLGVKLADAYSRPREEGAFADAFIRPFEEEADKVAAAFSREECDYLLRLLHEDVAKAPARKGRRSNGSRDYWITQVVARLVLNHGLKPTRNSGAGRDSPESACSVVEQVLGELRVGLSEKEVNTIWRKRRRGDFWWKPNYAETEEGRTAPEVPPHIGLGDE